MFCQKCGSPLQEGARFCSNCGYESTAGSVPNPQAAPVQQNSVPPIQQPVQFEKKNKKTGVIIGAVVVGLALIIVLLVALFGKGGTGSSNNNGNDNSAGNYEEASAWGSADADGSASKISKDYHSGELLIEGDVYKLPMRASDFLSMGWTIQRFNDTPDTIAGLRDYSGEQITIRSKVNRYNEYDYYISTEMKKGSSDVYIEIYNYTDQDIPVEEGYIAEIRVVDGDVILPGGFSLGDAKEDVVARWGEPDSGGSTHMKYDISDDDYDNTYDFYFDEDGRIDEVTLRNRNRDASMASAKKQDIVNGQALRRIAAADSFPVKITKQAVIVDYFKEGRTVQAGGDDGFMFTIQNNSDVTVDDVTICLVGYKENGEITKVTFGLNLANPFADQYIQAIRNEEILSLAPGQSIDIVIRGEGDSVYGIESIVYSFTSGGEDYINNSIENWVNNLYS